jgi:hypothetical protein
MVQGNSITFTDAKRSIITHFSIIGKMYEEAYATSNFKTLNVTSPLFQENLQATLLLKFNSAMFSLCHSCEKFSSGDQPTFGRKIQTGKWDRDNARLRSNYRISTTLTRKPHTKPAEPRMNSLRSATHQNFATNSSKLTA